MLKLIILIFGLVTYGTAQNGFGQNDNNFGGFNQGAGGFGGGGRFGGLDGAGFGGGGFGQNGFGGGGLGGGGFGQGGPGGGAFGLGGGGGGGFGGGGFGQGGGGGFGQGGRGGFGGNSAFGGGFGGNGFGGGGGFGGLGGNGFGTAGFGANGFGSGGPSNGNGFGGGFNGNGFGGFNGNVPNGGNFNRGLGTRPNFNRQFNEELNSPSVVYPSTNPTKEYGIPSVEYGTPADDYGPPGYHYGRPSKEYGAPVLEYESPSEGRYSSHSPSRYARILLDKYNFHVPLFQPAEFTPDIPEDTLTTTSPSTLDNPSLFTPSPMVHETSDNDSSQTPLYNPVNVNLYQPFLVPAVAYYTDPFPAQLTKHDELDKKENGQYEVSVDIPVYEPQSTPNNIKEEIISEKHFIPSPLLQVKGPLLEYYKLPSDQFTPMVPPYFEYQLPISVDFDSKYGLKNNKKRNTVSYNSFKITNQSLPDISSQ